MQLVDGNNSYVDFPRSDFGYVYPNNVDLRPGSPVHELLKTHVLGLAQESRNIMQQRYATWDAMNHKLTAFIEHDVAQAINSVIDPRKPTNVVVPLTYANYEVTLAHLMRSLLIEPILRYESIDPADKARTMLLELLIQHQNRKARNFMPLYTFLQDCLRYGFGVLHCKWEVREGQRRLSRDIVKPSNISPGDSYVERPAGSLLDSGVVFEGNVFETIDPYLYFPDIHVPIHEPHKGAFVGWLSPGNSRIKLEADEAVGGFFFNVRYLERIVHRSSLIPTTSREAAVGYIAPNIAGSTLSKPPIDILWMYLDLVPARFGLGPSERLEKWVVALASDSVIIGAAATNLDHGRCPVVVAAPEADGHTIMPIARVELTHGLQRNVDFSLNSHVAATMQMLKGLLVIDPGLISLDGLRSGNFLNYLLIKRSHWGLGKVTEAVKQLQVYDPTINYQTDMGVMERLMSTTLGNSIESQGVRRSGGERVTAQEIVRSSTGEDVRKQKLATVIYQQAFVDLAELVATHNRQFLSKSTYVRITGRNRNDIIQELGSRVDGGSVLIDPQELINTNWDTVEADFIPAAVTNAQSLMQLYQIGLQDPTVLTNLDTWKIFLRIARAMGETNAQDFIREGALTATVQPDATVQEGVEKGNLVPLDSLEGV